MQYIISGKNIDVTEVETKDRYYDSNERKYCTCRAGKQ